MKLIFIPRSEWGSSKATEDFIRNRYSTTAAEKTSIQVHHTAAIDIDDITPNRWNYDEARAYMRRLQTSRPDLGPLPYSENYAVSEDLQTVWVFEGRGLLKVGAHTAGYNRSGVGLGAFGNWDRGDVPAAQAIMYAMQERARYMRDELGMVNLGSNKNKHGWIAWGHRDTSPKSCPGNAFYLLLANFSLEGGEDDMAILTDAEQIELQKFLKELAAVNSAPNFVRWMIPWYRKWANNIPEDFAKKGEVGTLPSEETVRIVRAA